MSKKKEIIILGGGQAAAYAAKEIRSIDSHSNLTIVTEEKKLPYERPPLSKDYLLDKIDFEKSLFFPQSYYDENNIICLRNEKIKMVDFENKKLSSVANNHYNYDKLLIATGSKNKKLKINGLDQNDDKVLYLRNIKESKAIKDKIKVASNVTIIGGGFIGLEIASSANQMNSNVTVLERTNQLMGRVVPNQISKIIQDLHEENGNKIYLDVTIKKVIKQNNSFEIILDSNDVIKADLIIVGVGALPDTDMFINSSLKIDNGIITDEFSQTSIADVYAAGDVSNFFHPFYGLYMRLESFKHAQNHGINAGKNIVGKETSYNEVPWMWSDQFNLNLQLTGICNNYETFIQRGSNVEEGIIYFFLKNRMIQGACGVGIGGKIGRDIRLAGKLSERKIKVTKEILSDKNIKLNKLLS
jgi:3-phenylpropionate/trans-cinnamate dioxygenase ferredoxin reductase subunit